MNQDDGSFKQFASQQAAEEARKHFHKLEPTPNPHDIFHVGETVKLRNSRFRIHSIGNKFMVLRVLPTEQKTPEPST